MRFLQGVKLVSLAVNTVFSMKAVLSHPGPNDTVFPSRVQKHNVKPWLEP